MAKLTNLALAAATWQQAYASLQLQYDFFGQVHLCQLACGKEAYPDTYDRLNELYREVFAVDFNDIEESAAKVSCRLLAKSGNLGTCREQEGKKSICLGLRDEKNAKFQVQLKAVDATVSDAIQNGYGCWCYFGLADMMLEGRGAPKDTIDGFCKDLNGAYKCISEETVEETGTPCVPWAETYTIDVSQVFIDGIDSIATECEAGAVTNCAKKTCMVETYFAFRYNLHLLADSSSVNDDFKHATNENGPFDPETACPKAPHADVHPYCCGTYPYRTRKVSVSANTRCCGFDQFENDTDQCCNDANHFGFDAEIQEAGAACA